MKRISSLLLAIACSVTIGCGGGSSSGTPTPPVTPAVTAITPSSAITGGGPLTITVAGTGFVPASVVQWNKGALVTTFVSSTSLSAVLPASDLQSGSINSITVTSGSAGTSASTSFNVNNPLPVVTAITPASVIAGGAPATLTVAGSGFVNGSAVNWNGSALSTQLVSGNELTAGLPASDTSDSGIAKVTVTSPSPGGGTTSASPFTVDSPTPAITGISPQSVPAGAAASITVTGSGFESNSVLLWNGAPRPTTFVNATTLLVALSAADLKQSIVGSLAVSNPGPGAATSTSAPLAVVSPLPAITAVSLQVTNYFGACPQLQVTVTGNNFSPDATIQANGVTLIQNVQNAGNPNIVNYLPPRFVSKTGALSFTITNPGTPPVVSAPFAYPATSPAVLGICATPSPATVFPSSSFTVAVQPTEVNATGSEQVSVGTLPAGLSVSNAVVALPASGALLHFQAAASLAAGMDSVVLTGNAAAVSANATLVLTVSAGTVPEFGLSQPAPGEVAVPIGGSGSTQVSTSAGDPTLAFDITPSVTGLPPGTTATFSPASLSVGQSFTVTLLAAGNAPVTQNQPVAVVATPSAMAAPESTNFLADVTQPSGSLPDSQADFTSTDATPYAAVYDQVHQQIFASNPAWNRVDVLSSQTHQVIKRISIPFPQGIDISPDGSTVWVGTQSQQVYAINTTHLSMIRYLLPQYQSTPWTDYQLLALSDGTLLLTLGPGAYSGVGSYVLWSPLTNTFSTPNWNVNVGLGAQPVWRSGDGTKIYTDFVDSENCNLYVYDVPTQTSASNTSTEVCGFYGANYDGSRLVAETNAVVSMYDGSFNLLGAIPLDEPGAPFYFSGSFLFSKDGSTLYELANGRIATIDVASLTLAGVAPGIDVSPGAAFGTDGNGIVFDLPNSGVGFEDATFFQNYGTNIMPAPTFLTSTPYSGPLAGGTQFSPFGSVSLTPDVWFNSTRGTASVNGVTLTLTSPPASTPGPVNLKYIFPDGNEQLTPLAFSYSAFPQYAITSGATPAGGVPGTISGWGMPLDSSGGSMTVGGNAATITSQITQYPPFTGERFPTSFLDFTVPHGVPGWADISVTTPAGTGTLHQALFYAQSVSDYASPDAFTSVLYDGGRNQVYLTAPDHVDVFSLASKQFVTPLAAPAAGKTKQLAGLALTPTGNELLVTDLQDGSLAVIDPDTPANSFFIPIAPETSPYNNCAVGPLSVAASADQKAFVVFGSLPAQSCPASGPLYVADLTTKSASQPAAASTGCGLGAASGASSAGSTTDGSIVFISAACLYSAATGMYQRVPLVGLGQSSQISGDGNVLAGSGYPGEANAEAFADILGNQVQSLALPLPLYPSPTSLSLINPAYQAVFNASGSLQYIAYPNYFEIIDVVHGRLLVRFSLAETVQNTAAPIAIDPSGRYIFLVTTTGLTLVDLGEAPLAIGHLSSTSGSAGTQITIRGSGFDASLTATVGGQAATVALVDENTFKLTLPSAAAGPADLVLNRSDGSTYTLDSGVILQ